MILKVKMSANGTHEPCTRLGSSIPLPAHAPTAATARGDAGLSPMAAADQAPRAIAAELGLAPAGVRAVSAPPSHWRAAGLRAVVAV